MKPTVIIPVWNAQTTIKETLESLSVFHKELEKIIIINDGSTDSSLEIINKFIKKSYKKLYTVINHKKSLGLANCYNEGILKSKTDIIITMHADIILKKNAVSQILSPLKKNNVVAARPNVEYPYQIWQKYNFWQKCHFSRLVNKSFLGLGGRFDAIKKDALIKVGLFDGKTFKRAGEDGDMIRKLTKIGKIADSHARVIHVHDRDPKFGIRKYIYKNAQYANAQGATLKKYGITDIKNFVLSFFREILIISLFIPKLNFISIILITVYSVAYTKEVYLYELKNPRILILPLVNVYLLFISCYYSGKGYILGKQTV